MDDLKNSAPMGRSVGDTLYKMDSGTSLEQASTDNLYGLRIKPGSPSHSQVRDRPGRVFVVKPQINLSDYNILRNTSFYEMALDKNGDNTKNSTWNYVKCTLDPRLAKKDKFTPDYLDPKQAFITPISNGMISNTGWLSKVLPTKETTPGLLKQQAKLPDGVRDIYGPFDLDIVVVNDGTSVIDKLLEVWEEYIALNLVGKIMPYPDIMASVRYDYTTRVYRLVMCEEDKYVRHIACTGWAFPVNTEDGKKFDFNQEDTYSKDNGTRTIRFASTGAWYNDIRAMSSFNWVVGVFNPAMKNINYREAKGEPLDVIKVPREYLHIVENRAYPNINLNTFELEWWVSKNNIKEAKE